MINFQSIKQYIIPLTLVIITYSCNTPISNEAAKNRSDAQIIVNSKEIKEQSFPELSFVIQKSEYPQVTGFKNSVFEESFNRKIQQIVEDKIEEAKKNTEYDEEIDYMGIIGFRYEVDYHSKNLLILNIGYYTVFGGGNAWEPYSLLLFIDLKKEEIIESPISLFDFSEITKELINKKMTSYFEKTFPDEQELKVRNIKETEIKKSQFSIRNDSLLICSEQYPSAHYSYAIYKIPLLDLKKSGLKEEFNYLLEK